MLSPRWYKVVRDLWRNKTRTILVVLSIAIGVFAIGAIQSAQTIISRDLGGAYNSVNPASAMLFMFEPFDSELVDAVKRVPGVKDAEQRRNIFVRYRRADETEWRNIQLGVIPDFNAVRINKIRSVRGAWPPPERELLLETASLRVVKADVGDVLLIEAPDGSQREMKVAGIVYDFALPPPEIQQAAAGYITFETLDWLGASFSVDQLNIITIEKRDKAEIQRVTNLARDKVENSGRTVVRMFVPDPGKHPLDGLIEPLLLIMGFVGFLALGLSGLLVINTISAVLTQQVRQIGVMKAVGARTPQVMQLYFGMVAAFGALSLLCSVPLGALGALGISNFVGGVLNFQITSYSVPPSVLALQIGVGLLVPLIAAVIPIFAGARVTVREAIATYGLTTVRFGAGAIDQLISRIKGLSRPLLLSLRNTFRRKLRLTLTLVTLILASAIFITVLSLRDTLVLTLEEGMRYFNFDLELIMARSYRTDVMVNEAMKVPGVVYAEPWGSSSTRLVRADKTESDTINLIAPPADSRMILPAVVEGRWLLLEDENAIVINTDLLRNEPHLRVNDEVTLKIEGKDTRWRIVGVVRSLLTGPIIYMNYPYYARLTNDLGRAPFFLIETEQHDPAYHAQVAKAIEEHFKQMGLRISSTIKVSDLRSGLLFVFNFLIAVLLMMAVLLAVVGGLGLMGTMSINVLERTREIGVMRAIGASNGAVLQIVLVEGMLIGLLSWLAGAVLAIPLGKVLSDALGNAVLRATLNYSFSAGGAVMWLVVVLILSVIASFLPAWNASRLTVREVLAYE